MERLIIEIQEGDGYTYSCTNSVPVVFRSKEEFIIELEDTVMKALSSYRELEEKYEKALQKFRDSLKNVGKQSISKFAKEKLANNENLSESSRLHKESTDLYLKMRDLTNINIGGQSFNIENFLVNLKDGEFISPTVYTLDEFFAQVENYV
jgi:hypothetical protein